MQAQVCNWPAHLSLQGQFPSVSIDLSIYIVHPFPASCSPLCPCREINISLKFNICEKKVPLLVQSPDVPQLLSCMLNDV